MNKKIKLTMCLSMFLLILSLIIFPATQSKAVDVTDEVAREAGLSVGEEALPQSYDKGKYLGDMYYVVESFSLDGDYIAEPRVIPLYKGDRLSRIFNYATIAKAYTNGGGKSNSTTVPHFTHYGVDVDKGNFKIKGIKRIFKGELVSGTVPYPTLVSQYASSKGYTLTKEFPALTGNVDRDRYGVYMEKGMFYSGSTWRQLLNNKEFTNSMANYYVDGQSVKPGDVLRISFSIFGSDTSYDTSANKDELIKELAIINSYGKKTEYLKNKDFEKAYNKAVETLKSLSATEVEIKEAIKGLENKPEIEERLEAKQFGYYEGHEDYAKDFLLSSLQHTMKKGSEMELFCLDIIRASNQDGNFQREDLIIEPVVGADKVEIRKDSGDKLTVYALTSGGLGTVNTRDGAAYYVRGLKEGFVKLRISYAVYDGRPSYINLYISNRESDYSLKRLSMESSLDKIIKYDVIHFDDNSLFYPVEFYVEPGASATAFGNGKKLDLEKSGTTVRNGRNYDVYKGNLPLKNYWNEVIFTSEKGGVKTSKIYNLRSAYIRTEIKNLTREGEAIRKGDKFQIVVHGMLQPVPKIGKFYNPGGASINYYTDIPSNGFINTIGSTEAGPKAFELIATKSGKIVLSGGFLTFSSYGSTGWQEIPVAYLPDPIPDRLVEMISNVGGQNVPQRKQIYYTMPDLTVDVLENPDYVNPATIEATPDKDSYRPGETVTLNINIPQKDIEKINSEHSKYIIPKLEDGSDNPQHNYANQVNIGRVIYTTTIPGLKEVYTNPTAHNQTLDSAEKLRGIEALRKLTFTIPKGTPEGEYTLRGTYIETYWGPVWGMLYTLYNKGEFKDLTIKVGGEVLVEKPVLTGAKLIKPEVLEPISGELIILDEMVAKVREATESEVIEFQGKHIEELKIKYVKGAETVEKIVTEENGKYTSPEIPLQKGENKVEIEVKNSVGQKTYTLNIVRLGGSTPQPGVNKNMLKYSLLKAEQARAEDYEEGPWQELQGAIREAKSIIAREDATKEEVEACDNRLKKAIANVKTHTPISEELIAESLHPIRVNRGTSRDSVISMLPTRVLLRNNKGETREAQLQWRLNNYYEHIPQTYIALGFYTDPISGQQKVVELPVTVEGAAGGAIPGSNPSINPPINNTSSSILELKDPVKITIKKGENFTMPQRAEAKYVGGVIRTLPITWDNYNINTNEPGRYNIQGKVSTGEKINQEIEVLDTAPITTTTKPAREVKVAEKSGFMDIENHWAKEAINYVVEKGYFKGVSEREFAPNRNISKGEFITVLGRIAKVDASNYKKSQAKDLIEDNYYYGYGNWAIVEKIAQLEDNKFRGDIKINRELMAKQLYATLLYKGEKLPSSGAIEFKDKNTISSSAREAVNALTSNKILKGREGGNFAPKSELTRAEVAQILYNLDILGK